jgi:hypothetical protein
VLTGHVTERIAQEEAEEAEGADGACCGKNFTGGSGESRGAGFGQDSQEVAEVAEGSVSGGIYKGSHRR